MDSSSATSYLFNLPCRIILLGVMGAGKSTWVKDFLLNFRKVTDFNQLKSANPLIKYQIILFYESIESVSMYKNACKASNLQFVAHSVLVNPNRIREEHIKDPNMQSFIIFEDLQKIFSSFKPIQLADWENFVLASRKHNISYLYTLHDFSSNYKNCFSRFLLGQSTQIVIFSATDVSSKRYIAYKIFDTTENRQNFLHCFDLAYKITNCNYLVIQTDSYCSSNFDNILNKIRTDVFSPTAKKLGVTFSTYI